MSINRSTEEASKSEEPPTIPHTPNAIHSYELGTCARRDKPKSHTQTPALNNGNDRKVKQLAAADHLINVFHQ